MNKSTLIINVPELTDEAVAGLYDFLHEFILAFESHYYQQLQQYYQQSFTQDDDPF